MAKSKLNNIRALRGVAVLLVMASHLLTIESKYAGDEILPNWFISGLSGVDLFFVISGFIMVYVTRNLDTDLRTVWQFLLARVTRIYPLYWVISLAVLLVWLQAPHLVFSSISGQPDILKSFLLLPDNQPPLLAVGWTLIHEMYFYLIFAVGLFLPRKYLLGFLLIVSLAGLIGFLKNQSELSALARLLFSPLIFEFLGGAVAAFAVLRWQVTNWKLPVIAGGSLFVLALVISSFGNTEIFWSHANRALFFAPSASLLVYGMVVMEQNGKTLSGFLNWVGDQSYSLYLTHILTLSVVGRVWGWFAVPSPWDNIVMLPVLVLSSLIVGQLTYIMIERPLLNGSYWLRRKL